MKAFQQALEICEQHDLGYRGPKFTWNNCLEGQDFIQEQLDRGLANGEWNGLFPEAEVLVEVVTCSNHAILTLCLSTSGNGWNRQRAFRYEAKWAVDREHNNIIQQAWIPLLTVEIKWEQIGQNLTRCKQGLIRWQCGVRNDGQETIPKLQAQLQKISGRVGIGVGAEVQEIKRRLQVLLDKEALQWQQRAKIDLLRGGDQNTSFFHTCANA